MTGAVRVLFFARYAELVGRQVATVDVTLPATVGDVVRRIRHELPGGVDLPERPLAALNAVHTGFEAVVADGDEVALLPPIAGG